MHIWKNLTTSITNDANRKSSSHTTKSDSQARAQLHERCKERHLLEQIVTDDHACDEAVD